MTLYAIFEPKPGRTDAPRAVPEKVSVLALLLPPVFFLCHGLWLELGAFVIAAIGLGLAAGPIGEAAAVWLYVLLAVWLGLAAPSIRRAALARAGWRYRADLVAPAPDIARLVWLRMDRA